MAESDPLLALRNAIRSKFQITLLENDEKTTKFTATNKIQLSPSLILEKSTPTRLRRPGVSSTNPTTNADDFISLGAVYLAWMLKDTPGAEYMKQLRENGLTVFVNITEKKAVVDWLEGKNKELPNVVPLTTGV